MKNIIFIFLLLEDLSCQERIKSNFGIRHSLYYDFEVKNDNNFRVFHQIPSFTFKLNNNDFYAGPQFSYIFQPTPIANEIYRKNSIGLNFGYRIYSEELLKNFKVFGQFNFSIFQVKFDEYQKGSPYKTERNRLIVENTSTIGIDYKLINSLNLFVGFGLGSFNGFFLLFDEFNLSNYIGVEYNLK
jgi:hypothetical protein